MATINLRGKFLYIESWVEVAELLEKGMNEDDNLKDWTVIIRPFTKAEKRDLSGNLYPEIDERLKKLTIINNPFDVKNPEFHAKCIMGDIIQHLNKKK